jgi:hypothetical protein
MLPSQAEQPREVTAFCSQLIAPATCATTQAMGDYWA